MNFLKAQVLAEYIADPNLKSGKDYLVVDVRDEDYAVGHIPNALNIPAHEMYVRAGDLIDKYSHVPLMVFHCMQSQQRGPKAARIYRETVKQRLSIVPADDPLSKQKVVVLEGGFYDWALLFLKKRPELVEGFRQEIWDTL
ncbi:Cdc25 phosphatase Ibp1 [Coemansia sp. RSA 989]|nr:Rhodanese-like protein [Coemansia mojavensis]KAJ1742302.1 Cdc25 phosphatase Ibp1 [Coemansia sp. RSA 1086]KAJ1751709.1 Cdc25 phosphatase Ibp1 [Coemansia sp. RSA 1821]KAJ1866380.1 Cdc25 phosphatase Ibp1 [Coemansia sp. RSA 989]KAJ1869561.1 Cdc25 phosphatase Ibp1 [Coemansia sp. RSA 990]KAJ2653204.1 Cdc25 phosphatase Ibp1 [Coemansia sp. RSA 1250]KAJ2674466.1 Cdc25 phosphatase Ibp1 [Coemansia sp. RSA 1085]